MWPRLLQCGIVTESLAATSQTTTHAPSGRCPASVQPVGKALGFSREDCCCNLYHTNFCHYQQSSICTQIYLHTSKHMHTQKHLPPPLQTARISKCVLLRSRQWPKPSKLRCWDKHVCCVRVCLRSILIMLSVYYDQTLLSVGWHEL